MATVTQNTEEHMCQLCQKFESVNSYKFKLFNVNKHWCFEVELTLLSDKYKSLLCVTIFHKNKTKTFIVTADTFAEYLTFEPINKINERSISFLLYSILCQDERNNSIWNDLFDFTTFDNRDNQMIDKYALTDESKMLTYTDCFHDQFTPQLPSAFSFSQDSICHCVTENNNKMYCQLRCCYREYELANVVLKRLQDQYQNVMVNERQHFLSSVYGDVFDSEDNKSNIILRLDASKSELHSRDKNMNIGVYQYVSNFNETKQLTNEEDNILISNMFSVDDCNSSSDAADYLEEQMSLGLHQFYPNTTNEIPNNIEYEHTVNEDYDDNDDSFHSFGSGINQDELSDSDESNSDLLENEFIFRRRFLVIFFTSI